MKTHRYNLSVIGFPCNQFAHQEPADNETELYNGLKFVRPGDGYVPRFALMNKIDVNGVNETAFYAYLKKSCPLPEGAIFYPKESFWDPIKPRDISWNFEKFILDRQGKPLLRFLPKVEPDFLTQILKTVGNLNANVDRVEILRSVKVYLDTIENRYSHS